MRAVPPVSPTMAGYFELRNRGDRVRFAPGGKHLMLMKLSQVPRAGESVEVCLTFANHDDLCTDFPVRHSAP